MHQKQMYQVLFSILTNAKSGATISKAIQYGILNGKLKQAGGTTYGTSGDGGSAGTQGSGPWHDSAWTKRY